jgi:uncharacterized protein (TIGR00255 family)
MIESMTGFGSAEKGCFKVELRSVNHRFLDLSIKMPQNLSRLEMPLRNMVKERFSRGRFDILVSIIHEGRPKVRIDAEMARGIHDALRSLKDELSLEGSVSVETMAGFRELILSEDVEYDEEPLYAAFREAMEKLKAMRRREGEAIVNDMGSRLDRLEKLNGEVAQLCPSVVNECRERLRTRLATLFGDLKFDETRVLQEAAIMAEKADISEEITRITSHASQMKKILSDGDTIGRRAEFILQELNREVNTIASKADDYRISSITVEMKSELEKMREQAQNIQ